MTDKARKPRRTDRSEQEIARVKHREALLDDALDDTFPASDPPAMLMPRRKRPRKEQDDA